MRTHANPDTGLDVEEQQVRYLRPDWPAAAWWWLARLLPESYGPNAKSWDQVLDEFAAQELHGERDRAGSADPADLAERLQLALAQATPDVPSAELPPPGA